MTDLAEIVGGAIALKLLFGMPFMAGAVCVTLFSLVVLALKVRGRSHFDSVVLVLLVVIIGSLLWQVFIADVDRVALLRSVVPSTARLVGGAARRRHRRRDGHAARAALPLGGLARPRRRLAGARARPSGCAPAAAPCAASSSP